jgi:hypothetical protein
VEREIAGSSDTRRLVDSLKTALGQRS